MDKVRTKNRRELEAMAWLHSKGYKVVKRGWPDFLAYKKGKVMFVEVKRKTDPFHFRKYGCFLSRHQRRVKKILENIHKYRIKYKVMQIQ